MYAMIKKKVKVISAESTSGFESQINKALDDGWSLEGNMTANYKECSSNATLIYSQMMMKVESVLDDAVQLVGEDK